jgi:polyribonucleotide nucleotidyltransferase
LFGHTDGLLHISKISHNRVDKVEDVLKIGDIIDVKVVEIDNKGRVNVSAKALLPKPKTDAPHGKPEHGHRKKDQDKEPKENTETKEVKEEE